MLLAYAYYQGEPMQTERHVRLFRNGRNQAVRIPRDFELDGNEAIIRKDGKRLILEPVNAENRLVELLKTLEPIQEEFPEMEDPPTDDEDIF
jgi:antitoxin VapB